MCNLVFFYFAERGMLANKIFSVLLMFDIGESILDDPIASRYIAELFYPLVRNFRFEFFCHGKHKTYV